MKVLIISANWGMGGPGGISADLYAVLEKNGHECCFAYGRETVPEEIRSFRIGSMLDVYAHAAISRLLDNAGFASVRATRSLLKYIEEYQPDLISIQNPLGYTLHVGMLLQYIREKRIPAVWTLHDCWSFSGHCTTDVCEKLLTGCGSCPHPKEFPKSLFLDRSAQNLTRKKKSFGGIGNLHFIAPSEWIASLAKQSYLGNNEILTIPNGIDLQVFRPLQSDLRDRYHLASRKVLLAVANVWSYRKGAGFLYELMKLLDESYVLVMIGKQEKPQGVSGKGHPASERGNPASEKGNSASKKEAPEPEKGNSAEERKQDAERPEDASIVYIERTDNRQLLAEWYSTADVFVNPTVGDNFPTVNLEALACGTPVVTFDTGGSAESVGECGEVAVQGDIADLRRAIERCIDRKILPEECVRQASQYDREARYQEYVEYYERLVQEAHSGEILGKGERA